MADIVERLRSWVHAVDAVSASDLMDEAAGEIERLRISDEEREAIGWAIMECESMPTTKSREAADTLRALLKRVS